jgi:GST-like protein
MTSLADFPITQRWPARNPDVIQLYSLPTPNGIKVSAMLEETGLPYEPHLVDFGKNDQMTPEFISLNPNNKIPAIIDPNGPGGKPLGLFESGAILHYLAEKSGKFLPSDPALKWETLAWLHFQMGGVGPMFGQLGFFVKFAGKDIEDPRPRDRYIGEARRLLSVLEKRLTGRDWIMGEDYTIADIALLPWMRTLTGFYEAGELVGIDNCPAVKAWMERGLARPAMVKAASIPARPA